MCTAAALIRVVDPTKALGTSFDITILIMLGTYMIIINFSIFEVEEFKVLLGAHLMSSSSHEFVHQVRRFIVQQIFVSLSAAVNISAVLIALGMDKSLGPMNNGEWILLILRNFGVALWQANFALSSYMIYRNLAVQLATLMPPPVASGANDAVADVPSPRVDAANHAQTVVGFLKRVARTNAIKSFVTLVLCARIALACVARHTDTLDAVFSLPALWPYQAFITATAFAVALTSMCPGRVRFFWPRTKSILPSPARDRPCTRRASKRKRIRAAATGKPCTRCRLQARSRMIIPRQQTRASGRRGTCTPTPHRDKNLRR